MATDEPVSSSTLDFAPVPVQPRHDGLSPERQREFIEHLADTGIVAEAARLTGVTEQSVYRLRRRADARSFALAWDAALEMGVRRVAGLAIERALQGSVQRRYYHGELIEETRVHNDRLLMQILDKADRLLPPSPARTAATADFDSLLERIEQGDPEPAAAPVAMAPPGGFDVWMEENENEDEEEGAGEGCWYTNFPPPRGFDGYSDYKGGFGFGYRRTLTPAEQAVVDHDIAREEADERAQGEAARDAWFGFTPADPGARSIDPLD